VGGHGGVVAGSGRPAQLHTRGMTRAFLYERCGVEGRACFVAKPTPTIDAVGMAVSLGRCALTGTGPSGG
jgi:hypothetical protein